MINKAIKSFLIHPDLRHLKTDTPAMSIVRSQMLNHKPFLKKIYKEWYSEIRRSLPNTISGPVLELGSGGLRLKKQIPGLINSDIQEMPNINISINGHALPLVNSILRGIVMVNVLHHLSSISLFLNDAARCMKHGGRIVMIEPWMTRWSTLVYKYLHHESFDPADKGWHLSSHQSKSQENNALAWIIFKRDRKIFTEQFPQWDVKSIKLHSPFCYLLSGGFTTRNLMPSGSYGMIKRFDRCFEPWINSWAMFATIIIERNEKR